MTQQMQCIDGCLQTTNCSPGVKCVYGFETEQAQCSDDVDCDVLGCTGVPMCGAIGGGSPGRRRRRSPRGTDFGTAGRTPTPPRGPSPRARGRPSAAAAPCRHRPAAPLLRARRAGDHIRKVEPPAAAAIARGAGCEVDFWSPVERDGRVMFDPADLRSLMRPETKLVVVNFPPFPPLYTSTP